MSTRLIFDNNVVHFCITYSSKEDFVRDFNDVLRSTSDIITLWSSNGNDRNYMRSDFINKTGSVIPFAVMTVDEAFDGYDHTDKLFRANIGMSGASSAQVDARPVPRVFHLKKESVYKPGQHIEESSMYVHMEDAHLPVVDV